MKLAAGTSLVVRVMINYCHLLFVVPNILVSQLRDLNEAEAGLTKKAKNVKAIKKVLAHQKKHSLTTPRNIELPSPVVGQVSKVNLQAFTLCQCVGCVINANSSGFFGRIVAIARCNEILDYFLF